MDTFFLVMVVVAGQWVVGFSFIIIFLYNQCWWLVIMGVGSREEKETEKKIEKEERVRTRK